MTETDIWIQVFKKLNYTFKDEFCNSFSNSNILIYEGLINSRPHKIRLLFCRKTEIVFSVLVEDIHDSFNSIIYDKQSFKQKYKWLFRDVTISQFLI